MSATTMENHIKAIQKTKVDPSYNPVLPYIRKNVSQYTIDTLAHPCLLQHYLE
jgi:hypothetical protein